MEVDDENSAVIQHRRKSLLFSRDSAWIEKSGSFFDVTMVSFDGAEVCEMVGLFLLPQLAKFVGISNIGLYRNDGLAILDASGPDLERLRKKIIKLFQSHGLKLISNTNLVQTDFLHVTQDLKSKKYCLSPLSCIQEEFEKAALDYQEAMLKSGFAGELEYVKTNGSAKRSRKRNIVWFYPP